MQSSLGKQKAAGFAGMGGFCMGGEVLRPQLDSITGDGSMQEAMCAKAERASDHARRLAARHLAQAERFLGEAERLKALARALKSEALT